jgi:hypothetical protein
MRETTPGGGSRRSFLVAAAATGSAALAGCFALDQAGASDVVAHSVAETARTVTITITARDAEAPRTDRSLRLAPGETVNPVNDGKLPMNDEYTVTVDVESGARETFEWTDTDVELAPLHVLVDDGDNPRFLLQAG